MEDIIKRNDLQEILKYETDLNALQIRRKNIVLGASVLKFGEKIKIPP